LRKNFNKDSRKRLSISGRPFSAVDGSGQSAGAMSLKMQTVYVERNLQRVVYWLIPPEVRDVP